MINGIDDFLGAYGPEAGLRLFDKAYPYSPKFQCHEMGLAERLVVTHGQDIRFCPQVGWHTWDGSKWVLDEDKEIVRRLRGCISDIFKESCTETDQDRRDKLAAHGNKATSSFYQSGAIKQAESYSQIIIRHNQLDSDPYKFNCANGIIDLRTGKLLPNSRTEYCTMISPVPYIPNAPAPRWERFLNEVTGGDAALIRFLQKAIGYSLTGSGKEECILVNHWYGANGKSTFMGTIERLFGSYATRFHPELLMANGKQDADAPSPQLAKLRGKRLAICSESDDGQRLHEARIKQMTTPTEPITCRMLYCAPFEFYPVFKIWLSTNHRPQIRGTDHAIWRRIRLIPWKVTFHQHKAGEPEEPGRLYIDKDLSSKLEAELPGILTWAVNGCLLWQQEGLDPPQCVNEATKDYREGEDTLRFFLEDKTDTQEGLRATTAAVYKCYQEWTKENGIFTWNSNMFGRKMTERGFIRGRGMNSQGKKESYYENIAIRY